MFPELSITSAAGGGILIGLAAILLLYFIGRIAGISGIVGSLIRRQPGWQWRLAFVAGLVMGGPVFTLVSGTRALPELPSNSILLAVAGLLVGFGSRLGSGCTSGHGICGLSRLSPRSLVSVPVFMVTAMLTATLMALLGGV